MLLADAADATLIRFDAQLFRYLRHALPLQDAAAAMLRRLFDERRLLC